MPAHLCQYLYLLWSMFLLLSFFIFPTFLDAISVLYPEGTKIPRYKVWSIYHTSICFIARLRGCLRVISKDSFLARSRFKNYFRITAQMCIRRSREIAKWFLVASTATILFPRQVTGKRMATYTCLAIKQNLSSSWSLNAMHLPARFCHQKTVWDSTKNDRAILYEDGGFRDSFRSDSRIDLECRNIGQSLVAGVFLRTLFLCISTILCSTHSTRDN